MRHLWKVIGLLLCLYFVQTSVIVHASVHAFHEHDEEPCQRLEGVSHLSSLLCSGLPEITVQPDEFIVELWLPTEFLLQNVSVFHARAPPESSPVF